MKFLRALLISLSALLANLPFALAQCELNGEVIPCGEMPAWFWAIPLGFGAIAILGTVFWLWMLIDAIKNEKEDKIMWVLLIILLNLLGAILYYFIKKRKRS